MDCIIFERSQFQSLRTGGLRFVRWVKPDSGRIGSSYSISGNVITGVSEVDTRGGKIVVFEVSGGLNGYDVIVRDVVSNFGSSD
jgi:hypothetical protein